MVFAPAYRANRSINGPSLREQRSESAPKSGRQERKRKIATTARLCVTEYSYMSAERRTFDWRPSWINVAPMSLNQSELNGSVP